MNEGRIHSMETLGSLDGPGIRTVFFMQGCNMKCLYCHNRDSWDKNSGRVISVEEILFIVRSYRDYYGETGGVTFSGGEPLLQSEFLLEVVLELNKISIHTAIDTSGSVFSETTRILLDLADLVILDIKHSDRLKYRSICYFPGDPAFNTLKFLQHGETPYWIRQVILEGYTDSVDQVDHLRRITEKGRYPVKIELLPYHDMGKIKWTNMNENYILKDIKTPSNKLMNQLKRRLYNS